jgi:hypothetical protein
LKLVHSHSAVQVGPRPVQTFYYNTSYRHPSKALKCSHSKTPISAIKAAVSRMLDEHDLKAADIYDITQRHVWAVYRHRNQIIVRKIGR